MYVALEDDEQIFTTPAVRPETEMPETELQLHETDNAAESSVTATPEVATTRKAKVVAQRQSERQRKDKAAAAAAALTAGEEPPDQQPVDHDAQDHTNRNAGGLCCVNFIVWHGDNNNNA